MANGLTIKFSTEWVEEDADCSECYECGDIIVNKKHSLIMKIYLGEDQPEEEMIGICNSCYEMIVGE